eukprot:3754342-Alexandrium_andersonii.AAC.1
MVKHCERRDCEIFLVSEEVKKDRLDKKDTMRTTVLKRNHVDEIDQANESDSDSSNSSDDDKSTETADDDSSSDTPPAPPPAKRKTGGGRKKAKPESL